MASRSGISKTAVTIGAVLTVGVILASCDEKDPASAAVIPAKIGGKTFHLEVAADDQVRLKGLGGRTHIEDDGGMIFAFPGSQVNVKSFIMRDCPINMDILYLNSAGRVLTTYTMLKEEPRKADGSEGKEGDWNSAGGIKYDERLKRYSSRFPTQFVIEIQEGMVAKLGVKEGDQVTFDVESLKRRAK